jgi:hypothetical protein
MEAADGKNETTLGTDAGGIKGDNQAGILNALGQALANGRSAGMGLFGEGAGLSLKKTMIRPKIINSFFG